MISDRRVVSADTKPSLYDRLWAFFWCNLRFVRAWSHFDPVWCHRWALRRSTLMMLCRDAAATEWHAVAIWIAMREDWPGWRQNWRKTFPQWAGDD